MPSPGMHGVPMSKLFKSKPLWRTMEVPVDEPEQLTLMPAPTARSARAELLESEAGRNGRRKKLNGYKEARFFTWPKDGEEVLVLFDVDGDLWLPGYMDGWHMEARDGGEFGGQKVVDQVKVRDVRLQPQKAVGLSASLVVSLPHYARVESLDHLRRP